jgi:penicillin-binding protein 1C
VKTKSSVKLKRLAWVLLVGSVVATIVWFACPPPVEESKHYRGGMILRDREGTILRVGLGIGDVDSRPCYRAAKEDWIVKAVIASEDCRFLSHAGVSLRSLFRALWQNITSRRRISGASTITMQTVRLIQPHPRTWFWKGVETIQALRLERALSKEEILSQYLNRAPFASNFVGIESAAQGWFGKSPKDLNLAEASLLAGLLQSPTRFRPDRHSEAAKKRRTYVLERMEKLGVITASMRRDAEAVPFVLFRAKRPFAAPFFCDWALRTLNPVRQDLLTTLDAGLQQSVDTYLQRTANENACDGAAVVIEVATGAVRAMSCSGDYFSQESGQVNTATTPRAAGSTLKPFAFALAMDEGKLTPAHILSDIPRRFGNDVPLNFSGAFMGLVSARDALILSLNLPAIEVEELSGLPRFYSTLHQLGFSTLNKPAEHYGLGLVLGTGSVRLIDLANAYACLARGGIWMECTPRVLPAPALRQQRIFSEGAAWMVSDILSGGERSKDAIGHMADAKVPQFAWKTGTSSGFRDAWTVAWNPEYVIAVWFGNKRGQRGPDARIGKKIAAPVAFEIARTLYPSGEGPTFKRPASVIDREVCAASGRVPGPLCERRISGYALKECSSYAICPVHVRTADNTVTIKWPRDVEEFLTSQRKGPLQPSATENELKILQPYSDTTFRMVDGMSNQQIVFKISGATPGEPVYWFRNDALEGTSKGVNPFFWKPERGTHRFTCSTLSGAAASATITIE